MNEQQAAVLLAVLETIEKKQQEQDARLMEIGHQLKSLQSVQEKSTQTMSEGIRKGFGFLSKQIEDHKVILLGEVRSMKEVSKVQTPVEDKDILRYRILSFLFGIVVSSLVFYLILKPKIELRVKEETIKQAIEYYDAKEAKERATKSSKRVKRSRE